MADVVNPYGQVTTIPDEQLEQALSEGYQLATPEAAQARGREIRYGGYGGAAKALGQGLLSGASLGTSDVIGSVGLGLGEELRGYRDVNPELHTAGVVGGALVGGKIPFSPASGALRAAGAAERALGGGLLGSLGRGAVEGAFFGAGQGLHEVALDKDPVSLEKATAVILNNAAVGGAIGGAFGLGGGLLSRRGGASAAARVLGEAEERGVGRLADTADWASSTFGGSRRGDVAKMIARRGPSAARGLEIAQQAEEIMATSARELGDDLATMPLQRQTGFVKLRNQLRESARALGSLPEEQAAAKLPDVARDMAERIVPPLPKGRGIDEAIMETATAAREEQLAIVTEAVKPHLRRATEAAGLQAIERGIRPASPTASVVRGIVGGIAGGPAGAVLGAFGGALSSPEAIMRRAIAVDSILERFTGQVGAGVKGYLKKAGSVAEVEPLTRGARGAARAASYATTGAAATRGRTASDKRGRYAASRNQAQQIIGEPGRVDMAVSHALGPLAREQPGAAAGMAQKLREVSLYLMSKDPAGDAGIALKRSHASLSEIGMYLRREEVARDPLRVLGLLKERRLSRQHIETVKELWPAVYAEIQQHAIKGLAQLAGSGRQLPYKDRVQLGMLLELETDPSLSPQMVMMLQQNFVQPTPTQPPGNNARIPKVAESFSLESEKHHLGR